MYIYGEKDQVSHTAEVVGKREEMFTADVVDYLHALIPMRQAVVARSFILQMLGFLTAEEFLYDIEFESERVKSQLKSAVAINLVEKKWDPKTGIVTLVFNTVFAPNKPMRNSATLVVQCITGGIWKFPLLLVATEPEVDDVINIEATGLNKESVISFRLTSKTRDGHELAHKVNFMLNFGQFGA
ncbi:UNVERIFIED_CONTAM: hypothetical protein K2H54_051908 [Gekko kuhli]